MSDRNDKTDDLMSETNGGWMSNFLADEEPLDRRALWRLGSWGVGSVGALIVGIMAMQSPVAMRRDQLAVVDMAQQSQQVQWIAKESQNQARQLIAAVETLNADRDRLYARVTVLEQGLDSVTGSIAKQSAASALPSIPLAEPPKAEMQSVEPPPKIAPVASIPATLPPSTTKQPDQKPDVAAADKSDRYATGAVATTDPVAEVAAKPVPRTEFGIDLGGANSVEGLRALWRGVSKSGGAQIAALTPIIVVKERNDGLGMQLRLVAGPLDDAAASAKICAGLIANNRACETSVYNGQRLALQNDAKPGEKAAPTKRKAKPKTSETVPSQKGTFSSIFGGR